MATTEFDLSLPSIKQLQSWIKQTTITEFKLLTGETITGKVFWQDHNCVSVLVGDGEQITIWKQAIAYMKAA
jgi:host factor-I protein